MCKWDSYVLYDNKTEITQFWKSYYSKKTAAKVLFVLGKGFDPRMNNIIKLWCSTVNVPMTCLTMDFPAGDASDGFDLYQTNVQELKNLQNTYGFSINEIKVDSLLDWERRIKEMGKKLARLDLSDYSDIILDVSSMPRAIYFNVAKVFYEKEKERGRNLFFMVSENVEIDNLIVKDRNEEEVFPLVGFKSMIEIESYLDKRNILIPLIGEERKMMLESIYNDFKPSDVCPVMPFPSHDPRRSDKLLLEYNQFLKDRLYIEPQSVTYAHERNPFELYRLLDELIHSYQNTLKPISGNICFGIALLTSKLLSLGALLVGLEHNDCVAIYNVSSTSYKIKDKKKIVEANQKSKPFLLWITGEAYEE